MTHSRSHPTTDRALVVPQADMAPEKMHLDRLHQCRKLCQQFVNHVRRGLYFDSGDRPDPASRFSSWLIVFCAVVTSGALGDRRT